MNTTDPNLTPEGVENSKPVLIGICGDIGSGKDTVANHLVDHRGFKRVGLADKLKLACAHTLQVDDRHFFGTQAEKAALIEKLGTVSWDFLKFGGPWPARVGKPWTGRWVTEFIGTECFRLVYGLTWVDHVMSRVEDDRDQHYRMDGASEPSKMSIGSGWQRHVVPDIRFANEFTAIREAGGKIWRTVRLNPDTGAEERSERTGHVSDGEWRDIPPDHPLLAYTGDLQALRDQADALLGRSDK